MKTEAKREKREIKEEWAPNKTLPLDLHNLLPHYVALAETIQNTRWNIIFCGQSIKHVPPQHDNLLIHW
jgi:hypothetical protein